MARDIPALLWLSRLLFAPVLLNGAAYAFDQAANSGNPIDFDGTNTYPRIATTTGAAPNLSYTLIAHVYADLVYIRSGIGVRLAGHDIRADTVDNQGGTVHDDGNAAVGGTAGASLAAAGLRRQSTSGVGGTGRTTTGAGNPGAAAGATGQIGTYPAGILSTGAGAGGTAGGGNTGGAGGSVTSTQSFSATDVLSPLAMLLGQYVADTSVAMFRLPVGGGGGGGGANVGTGSATAGGGGGGGGGGAIIARRVSNSGRFGCRGGAGGNAAVVGNGVGGGGGGGMGGTFVLVYEETFGAGLGTVDCNGGAAGAGAGTGGLVGVTGGAGLCFVVPLGRAA